MTYPSPRKLQLRRGNTAAISAYTGPVGEIVINTDTWALYIQDGTTVGGHLVSGGGGGSYISSTATSVATSDGLYDTANTFNSVSITSLGFYNNTAGYISIVKL